MEDFFEIQKKAMFDVIAERANQDTKWGPEHDNKHPTYEFVELINDYAGWARILDGQGNSDEARKRLIQVAALAVAAVETIDRKKADKNIIQVKNETR